MSWFGPGHRLPCVAGRSHARNAALLDPDLGAADPAVRPVLVVAVGARLGELVAQFVHGILVLALGGVVFGKTDGAELLRVLHEVRLVEGNRLAVRALAAW